MFRRHIPFFTGDVSALARSLEAQLDKIDCRPGHLELLNMLARAAGYRNFQSLRAQQIARERLETPAAAPQPVDYAQVQRLVRCFDARGRLARWPSRHSLQAVCLWVLWSRIPPRRDLTEHELNGLLQANHLFGDHALLRRELCDHGLLQRPADGRSYRRMEKKPTPEGLELIRRIAAGGAR